AKIVAKNLGTEYDVLEKKRIDEYNVVIVARKINVKNRDIVIVDDIISTGGTVIESVNALKRMGARKIIVACTHPLLVKDALRKIYSTGVYDLIGTNTVPSPISYISVAPVLANALK
ncbi:MAG TPA: ribose-phosphate diphosphokinase, partial [Thermoprotei archaeon]|nr:ribose-phosphate diphosphokinase [Thermoprotei archaeon]